MLFDPLTTEGTGSISYSAIVDSRVGEMLVLTDGSPERARTTEGGGEGKFSPWRTNPGSIRASRT
jgi:hypothetical protein